MANKILDEHGMKVEIIQPDYGRYGKRAPLVRDEEMVDRADIVIALWDFKSHGTKYTIDYAKLSAKPVEIYDVRIHDFKTYNEELNQKW